MAIYANLSIDQGATFTSIVSVKTPDGFPFDLTDYTVEGQVRKSYFSTTSIPFDIIISNALAGTISLELSATVTATLKPGRYVYDILITNFSTNEVIRVIEGQVEVNPGVTRENTSGT